MSEQLQQMQEILKKSLLKIKQLEADLATAKAVPAAPAKEPVAIIGLGCRFPGGVKNLEQLWQLLINKQDVSKPIPKDRWDNDAIYDPDPLRPGHTHARTAAFLEEDVRAFDADFFGIVPREAKSIDPLQRMILEVVYEALEEAGIAPDSLKGSNTAVYIALGNSDYIQARFRSGNLDTMDVYDATGIPFATAAGRVSYLYDLQGPNFALDAACASSIVGLHLASEVLQKGEADMAIVASANLLLTPELFVGLSKLGSLSASGMCKAFADDADGYVRGEGCGVAVLKRKSDAIAHQDHIHALILGSAVKHDGLSNGFTAPNPKAQLDTIQAAIKDAGIQPEDISFVEAHGIGNKFTDAMEIQAIANGYKNRSTPIYTGSLKPNIGHLEACIGMAMLFKVIGTLKHATVAPNIHISQLNSDIPWSNIPVKVPTEAVVLSKGDKPLRAAINLSGYSGTNVHMIFEEAPKTTNSESTSEDAQLILLSAKTKEALQALAEKYITEASTWQGYSLDRISRTTQLGRNHLDYRLAIVADKKDDVIQVLTDFKEGKPNKKLAISPEESPSGDVAFLFTGQGTQYPGMCKELYEKEPAFRQAADSCATILKPLLDKPILELIFGEDEDIHQTQYTQTALFVVEYALAQWWMSVGIRPAAVAGHSVGEFVALTIADALTLEDALQLVTLRGKLMQSLPADIGSMSAVLASEEKASAIIQPLGDKVNIAAINAPDMLTISGDKESVATAVQMLKDSGIKSIPLTVSHAFHSYLMEPALAAFEAAADKVSFQEPSIPVMSNVSGGLLQADNLTGQYFGQHLRGTVRFADNLKYLVNELGISIFVECGPNPTLSGFGEKNFPGEQISWLSSAKKGSSDLSSILKALQGLYVAGQQIQWSALYQNKAKYRVSLPTYAWQKQVYWENPVRGIAAGEQKEKPVQASATTSKTSIHISKENLMAVMQLEGCDTLGLHPGQKLDPNKSLREQGFDSMMSGEFLSRMEKYFNTQLEMSLLHTYGTMNELQRYFIDEYLGGGEVSETAAVTMNDIVFGSDSISAQHEEDWHRIKETDPLWLKVFKKIDEKISI